MADQLLVYITVLLFACVQAQQSLTCPGDLGWYKFGEKCYKFNGFPKRTRSQASTACQNDGATLLSVNTVQEHDFIDQWLRKNDESSTDWITSGSVVSNGVRWSGDGTVVSSFNKWIVPEAMLVIGKPVIFSEYGTQYGWSLGELDRDYAYICEISVHEVYRIVQQSRDFDYGLNVDNPSLAPRGPVFIQEPTDTVVLGRAKLVHLDCVANGLPEPTYEWRIIQTNGEVDVLGPRDRLTFTTGRLSISDPEESDAGTYQCVATNDHGTVLSSTARLTFGNLGEFSNVQPAAAVAYEFQGTQLVCPRIIGSPAIRYTWYKDNFMNFIRPNFQKSAFISSNGKLFFSELAPSDEATYYCVASLSSFGSPGNYLGAYQTPTRTSLGVRLEVRSGTGSNFEPDIQNDFIFVYPSTPMRGGNVRMECFAYGILPLVYSWRREGKPLPLGIKFEYDNRIMELSDVRPEDGGTYVCTVRSSKSGLQDERSYNLVIQSKPFFTYPLQHQHVDVRSSLTWHCDAHGTPRPEYQWYKNGQVLESSPGVSVQTNTLTIDKLAVERDNGMYQCAATNRYGTTFSSAQLRVLEIPPNFDKTPMIKSIFSAVGGNVTLVCDPTAAPLPSYQWFRNGNDLGLVAGNFAPDSQFKLLLNGNLLISGVRSSDQGRYTCKVENDLGSAEDYTNLMTMDGIVMSTPPSNDKVEVNFTATLLCQASHPPNIDMVYLWKFNDHLIDYNREPEYRPGTGSQVGSLYIVAAQFKNEGTYTCIVETGMEEIEAIAYLTVIGPPAEPAGVHIRDQSILKRDDDPNHPDRTSDPATTRWLVWTDGSNHGATITHYFIHFRTEFDMEWRIHPDGYNIPVYETMDDSYPDKHFTRLTNLKAGAGVQFRVQARNAYGIGAPSIPTAMIQIVGTKPSVEVTNVRGGGGSVGDLTIMWDPLPLEDHNAPGVEYRVFWRAYRPNNENQKFSEKTVPLDQACVYVPDYKTGLVYVCKYVELVGPDEFYKPYEAMVQVINSKGEGPVTDPVIIMSAEDLPLEAPTNVKGYVFNATALMIRWNPIPNDRQSAHGKLKGYRINYWRKKIGDESNAVQNIIELKPGEDNLDHGVIIGLEPIMWYYFNVQAYNSAGLGPKSSKNEQQCLNRAPGAYPTEVHVSSIDGYGVRVSFRGISTKIREEPLQGYKVQYWKAHENLLSAREADFGKLPTGVIRNLTKSELYQLRVYGYSRGGQGKRSSPSVFFTVGEGEILYNPETMEILSSGHRLGPSVFFVAISYLIIHLFGFHLSS